MKLFFRKYGSGPPLLILHGLFGQSDNWNSMAKRFGENGFTAIPVDLRNHGLSPQSDQWNYDLMAEDVVQMIIDNDLDKVNIIGHSMGGKVAMKIALLHSGIVNKMIIADIAPKKYPRYHDDVLKILKGAPLSKFSSRKEGEEYMLKAISDPGMAQFLLKNLYRTEAGNFAWRFNLKVIADNYSEVSKVVSGKPVDTSVLFLRGEKSTYIRDEDFEAAKSLFPNSSLLTVQGSGHWIHAEKPEDFFKAVTNFLATGNA